jgi:hypothetical protein
MNQRLTVYRRMAAARTEDELRALVDEVRDRYGPLPDSVLNLADYAASESCWPTRSWIRPGCSASTGTGRHRARPLDLRGQPSS